MLFTFDMTQVAPYTGAWIEIDQLPNSLCFRPVAPYTGAWIEMHAQGQYNKTLGRSLHGSVD